MKDFLETWTMQVKQWQNATKIVALYPAIPFRPRYDVSECASAQALRSKAGIYRMMWSNMLSMFGKVLHCFAISCYHGVQNNVHWHTPSINQWLHMSSLSDTYANSYIYIYICTKPTTCVVDCFPLETSPRTAAGSFPAFPVQVSSLGKTQQTAETPDVLLHKTSCLWKVGQISLSTHWFSATLNIDR